MQREIGDEVHIGESVTPFKSVGKSAAINKTASDFDNTSVKLIRLENLLRKKYNMLTLLVTYPKLLIWFFRE